MPESPSVDLNEIKAEAKLSLEEIGAKNISFEEAKTEMNHTPAAVVRQKSRQRAGGVAPSGKSARRTIVRR